MPQPSPAAPPPPDLEEAEAAYERFVWKNLPRNFAGHFMHGMLGMTGFRLFNAPTFRFAARFAATGYVFASPAPQAGSSARATTSGSRAMTRR